MKVPDAVWKQLGFENLRETPEHAALGLFGAEETANMLDYLAHNEGVTTLTAPQIIAANRQEATVSIGSSDGTGSAGKSLNIGITPQQRQTSDGEAFDLVFDVNQNKSYDAATANMPNVPSPVPTQP